MKTKYLTVKDTFTRYHVLVLQLEAADGAFCEAAGVGAGLKIVLHFSGRRVSCIAGYEMQDDLGATFDELSASFPRDGTAASLKEILHYVDDIRRLPDQLDVEGFRRAWALLRHREFVPDRVREILGDEDVSCLRKVLYRWGAMLHLAIVDVGACSVLFDIASTGSASLIAEYLWIPLEEAKSDDLASVDLCPFKYELV